MSEPKPTVLVLGAAGLIGTAVRRRLAPRFRLVSVDVRPLPSLGGTPIEEEAVTADVGDTEAMHKLLDRVGAHPAGISAVINLAAYYDFRNRPDPRYEALEGGLARFLTLAKQSLPPHAPFLHASSMAAMAPTEPGIKQTADSPRAGLWAYPAHKLRCEEILETADTPQPRVELVLAAVYSDWCELVPLFQQIERVRSGSPEQLFYPGQTDRGLTYVHLSDVADAFARGIEVFRSHAGVHRLLIGEDRPVSYRQIQDSAHRQFIGRKRPILRVPRPIASVGAQVLSGVRALSGKRSFVQPWMVRFAGEHFEFDIRETERVLGWRPTQQLADALPAMLQRAHESPAEWLRLNEARPW